MLQRERERERERESDMRTPITLHMFTHTIMCVNITCSSV